MRGNLIVPQDCFGTVVPRNNDRVEKNRVAHFLVLTVGGVGYSIDSIR